MASKNKTYIQKAIDKTLRSYESPVMGFLKIERAEIENLKNKLYAIIAGNESEYIDQVNERIQKIEERLALKEEKEIAKIEKAAEENFRNVDVKVFGNIPEEKVKVQRNSFNKGKAVGLIAALAIVGTVATVSSCGSETENNKAPQTIEATDETTVEDVVEETLVVETISEKQKEAEAIVNEFSNATSQNTITSINALLANGVKIVEFDSLTEEQQKELMAEMGLQYYLVANIDDITTLEYANFMKEQPNAVLDNDDLIYNFRNFNVLLKQQMLVCTPDNKIDFSNIYQSEYDAQLLNDGAELIARLNVAETKKERKQISKEIFEYIENTLLNSTSELKYSNSAMATFINVEFSAWKELTKSSGYGYGCYPDDELEAKLMTVASTCGMSEGEKTELELQDETKTSLESINVIRILNTLNERKENILTLNAIEGLYYIDNACYGDLKQVVMSNIDLTKYVEIQSLTEKIEEEIKNTPKETHTNDSGVSNGQGGTISKEDMVQHNVNPSSPNAKEEYEQKVEESYQESTVVKNEQGEVIDPAQAAAWAQQGAIDANNGTKNNNVPAIYQDAYNNGWNTANEIKLEAEKLTSSTTTFVPEANGEVTTTVTEETKEDFKESTVVTPAPEVNENTNSTTTFVPVTDGEVTEIVVGETVEGFLPEANSERVIEVQTLSRNEKVQAYKDIKTLLEQINNSFDSTINIYNEIEENHMTK